MQYAAADGRCSSLIAAFGECQPSGARTRCTAGTPYGRRLTFCCRLSRMCMSPSAGRGHSEHATERQRAALLGGCEHA